MVLVLILVTVALVVSLAFHFFGSAPKVVAAHQLPQDAQAALKAKEAAEAELDKRKKELEEQRKELQELRADLKATKRKLFEQKASGRDGEDLAKARAEVERSASVQLETVRAELATALAELEKLRANTDTKRRAPEPSAPPARAAEPSAADKSPRKFRELNDADREKMERLEHQANKERGRAQELEREVKRLKGRSETQHRVYVVTKGELDLVKDKFKALEKRLNRTLLERDLMRRAIKDLEKKSGMSAERTEPTADELAASDQKVEDRTRAEAAEAERRAQIAQTEPDASKSPEEPAAPSAVASPEVAPGQ